MGKAILALKKATANAGGAVFLHSFLINLHIKNQTHCSDSTTDSEQKSLVRHQQIRIEKNASRTSETII